MKTVHTRILAGALFLLYGAALLAQSTRTFQPAASSVYALAASGDGANGTNLFAGTFAGVFRSTDNGGGWTAVNAGLTNTSVFALAVSGTNLFAGTKGGGVFRSTDNGASWTAASTGLTDTRVYALAASPGGSGGALLWAGTGGGVFLSSDNGVSWAATNAGLKQTSVLAFAFCPAGPGGASLFAGTHCGVFRSTDNGASWSAVNSGLADTSVYALEAFPHGADGTTLFAGTQNGGVYQSADNGASWIAANAGLASPSVLVLAANREDLFAGTYTGGVFRSTDNGANWTAVNTGLTSTRIYALASSGSNLFAGTSGGVFLSTNNGAGWTAVSTGLEITDDMSHRTDYSRDVGATWQPFDVSTIVVQVPAGLGFAAPGLLIAAAAAAGENSGTGLGQGLGILMGGVLGAFGMPTGVYFGGKWMGGDGSYLATLLGALLGGGVSLLPNIAAGTGDMNAAFVRTAILAFAGGVIGYHLSASNELDRDDSESYDARPKPMIEQRMQSLIPTAGHQYFQCTIISIAL